MATPAYTTDLTNINLGVGTWVELTGALKGGGPAAEGDYFIEGSGCISQATTVASTSGNTASMAIDLGTPVTINSGDASFHWIYFGAPNAIAMLNSGGYRIVIGGSGIVNYKMWYVLGSDTYTYGGWQNIPIDPRIPADQLAGVSTAGTQVFGSSANISNAVSKGSPYGNDAIRYGRTLQIINGVSGDSATFAGTAAVNDTNYPTTGSGNRWGLFQGTTGGYLHKGLLLMGTAATAVDFRDTNRNILIQDTIKVWPGFNAFEVRNAASVVHWTGISISSLGTTSKGRFITTNNAEVNFDTCSFTDMDSFDFLLSGYVTTTTFRRCGIVTQSGATIINSKFDNATGTKALQVADQIAKVTNTTFISDGTGYAVEGFTAAGSYNLTNLTWTNYAASDGATGNEAIHVLATTGVVNLNISGGTTPSVHSEGATVNKLTPVSLAVSVKNEGGTALAGAQVYIQKPTPGSLTSDAGNNVGDGDFVVNEVVDTDIPQSGWIIIWNKVNNGITPYRYVSWAAKTFTLRSAVTGTCSSLGTETQLLDTGSDFGGVTDLVEGDTIYNTTDLSWAVVDEIVNATELSTMQLQGGSNNIWQSGDGWRVNRLALSYTDTDDIVDVPIINEQTNTTSGMVVGNYNGSPAAINVRIRKNQGTPKYLPYNTSGNIGANGYTLTAVMTQDDVAV